LRRAQSRWQALWKAPTIALAAVFSFLLSIGAVHFLGRDLSATTTRHGILGARSAIAHAVAFAFLFLDVTVVVGSIAGAFRRGSSRSLLVTVLTSYVSLQLVFASIFFLAAFFGDYEDSVFKYDHYRTDAIAGIDGPRYNDRRAFSGIHLRFWSGVDWPVRAGTFPGGLPPGAYEVSVAQMRRTAATYTISQVVQFLPEAGLMIFGDCLHLSVVTMTTVGYGDIVPDSLLARIAADVEALCNPLLLIFGLGIIFENWRTTPPRT
jgi:hypothetical protein